MCYQCHQGLSDATVLNQMKECLTKPNFAVWNETSVNHFIIIMLGYNGNESAQIATQIFKNYLQWKKENLTLESECCVTLNELTKIFIGVNRVIQYSKENPQLQKEEILTLWNKQPEALILLECSDRSFKLLVEKLKQPKKQQIYTPQKAHIQPKNSLNYFVILFVLLICVLILGYFFNKF
jgi:hypothetical protein